MHLLESSPVLCSGDLDGVPIADENYDGDQSQQHARSEEPSIMALSRNRFSTEPPTGRKLEEIKSQMLRIHRASGHTSMANLQRLLRARKAPQWAIDLAGNLKCPECVESKRRPSPPVASLHETPGLFEIIGTDIFEFEGEGIQKFKYQIIRDRASGLVMTYFHQQYGGPDEPSAWEPTTTHVIQALSQWMMHNPAPRWILTDSAAYFTSQQMIDYAARSGVGLLTTPAESYQTLGTEEGAMRILKGTVDRLLKEEPELPVPTAFALACHGHNQAIGPSGFSPVLWSRGSTSPLENIPLGLNPHKAFGEMLKLKEKARVAYEMESARARISRLNNTVAR